MHFARLLRRAGLPVGPAETIAAQDALTRIDLAVADPGPHRAAHRHDPSPRAAGGVRPGLRLVLARPVGRRTGRRDGAAGRAEAAEARTRRRPAAAASPKRSRRKSDRPPQPKDEPPAIDMTMTVSDQERLQQMDFEAMSAAEIDDAKREIRRLVLPLDLRRTRRLRPDPTGPVTDLRRTIRASLRQGGEILTIARNRRVTRPPPLVVLCDISGSMSRYAQILLHFLHAVTNDRDRVTRLPVRHPPDQRHPPAAAPRSRGRVPDGRPRRARLVRRHPHRRGAGRVQPPLGRARAGPGGGGAAGHRRAGPRRRPRPGREHGPAAQVLPRLIWLNPLLRWNGFEPRSQGIRAMLPHVDEFRPVHNLASLRALIELLSRPAAPARWRDGGSHP